MIRYALIYGAIAGAVIIALMSIVLTLSGSENFETAEIMGYAVMIAVLSLIFIGVKRYRDVERGGVIKFAGAFGTGVGIAIVASIFYAISWEFFLAMTDYAFLSSYPDSLIAAIEAEGLAEAERAERIAEVEAAKELYANPPFRLMISFIEIFPVGLLVALVSALLLKNPKLLPARAAD